MRIGSNLAMNVSLLKCYIFYNFKNNTFQKALSREMQ